MRGISPIAQTLRSQARLGLTQRHSDSPEKSEDRAESDVSAPVLAERQIAFLVWHLCEENFDETLAELHLLVNEFGVRAQHALAHELHSSPTSPFLRRARNECITSGLVSQDMFTPLPDVNPNTLAGLPADAGGATVLDAALEHLARARQAALAPQALAAFLASFLEGDGPLLCAQRQQLVSAVSERVSADAFAQAISQALPKLGKRTLAEALLDLGPDGLPTVELAEGVLRHFSFAPSAQSVAQLLGTLLSAPDASARPLTNFEALTRAVAKSDKGLSWAKAIRGLDKLEYAAFTPSVALGTALAAVLRAAPTADSLSDAGDVAVAGLWGVWTHRLRQLQLLYSLLVLGEDTFTFSALPTRRILTLESIASAPVAVKTQGQHALDTTWNSLDLIETLMELAGSAPGAEDSAEVGKAVTAILERAIKTHADIVLLGLVQLPLSTNAVHPELVSKLLVMFLAGHAQHQLVFWTLYHTQSKLFFELLLRVYAESPLHLTRIVEVAQELGFVDRLLELRPLAFAMDAAAFAARRDLVALEPWLQKLIGEESHVIHAALEFLEGKIKADLLRRDPQIEPTFVPLSVQSVATFLRVLRANGDSMSPEEIEHFKVVRNLCLQLHPRLMTLTPGPESVEPGLSVASFSKEIHREADSWYRQMYEEKTSVDDIIALLQRCKLSDEPHDHQLFACMVHTLFDEHRWFELYYPPRELLMTAVVFGSLIQYQLVDSIPLGIAIRYVLDALRSPPDSTMFHFGIQALLRFQTRLAEWPQLCHALLALPQLQQTHPEIVNVVNHALANAKSGKVPPPPPVPDTRSFPAINPETLPPNDGQQQPTEEVSDKILFVINNLTAANLDAKLPGLRDMISTEILHWFAKYLVIERASIEPNNHDLYMQVLDGIEQPAVFRYVLYETLVKLKSLLESEKTMQSTSERTVLKNLASWLGSATLAKNKPIRFRNLALKELLLQGHESGRLIVVIPFVCKVLEHCATSDVFQPPNPWLMAVCRLLVELYQFADLKLNLKFEIEVLCKSLQVDLQSLEPSALLIGRRPTEPVQEAPYPAVVQGMEKLGVSEAYAPPDTLATLLQNMAQYIVVNPQLVPYANNAAWKRVMFVAIERAIQEIITPVVERSVTIASISTRELVSKDFAMEPDELKMAAAAHHMAQSMAGSLALVTCKEPLRVSILAHARTLFAAGGVTEQQLPEQGLLLLVQDNLDLACMVIEKTAMEKALSKADEGLAAAYTARREFRAHGRGTLFWDSSALSHYSTTLPDLLRIAPPGLQPQQQRVYESLAMPAEPRDERPVPEYEELAAATLSPAKALERFLLIAAKLEQFFAEVGDAQTLATLPATHFVRQVSPHLTELVNQAAPRDETILIIAQKVVQLLYKTHSGLARDVWVALLEQLCEQSLKVAKEVTAWLIYAEDERKFNVPVTVALMRANLVGLAEQDAQLAKLLVRSHFRPSVVEFSAALARECLQQKMAGRGQLQGILGALRQAVQYGRTSPAIAALLEEADDVPSEGLPLREQLAYSFASWVRAYQQSPQPEKSFIEYVTQLQGQNVLKGEEISSLFFRVCTEVSVDHYLKQQAVGGTLASGIYSPVDTFAKMIVYMVKYHADPLGVNDEQAKVHYLTKILSIIVLVLAQSHEELGPRFQQRPFFRLFSSLLHDLHAAEGALHGAYGAALLAVGNSLNTLQPLFFPGFAFAWVSLVSHRLFLPQLLKRQPEGRAAFHRLFLAQLRFLAPFLRQSSMHDTTRLLYQATLRMLLLLLHDFPEYLTEHHQSLVDAIPATCIQMRNLVLCAFPRTVRLPDPFAQSVRVQQLPDASHDPVVLYDFHAVLSTVPKLQDALEAFARRHAPPAFLSSLKESLTLPQRGAEARYNEPVMNAAVLYVATLALDGQVHLLAGDAQHDPLVEMYTYLLHELEPEGRYLLLSAAANQLRYPSRHTAYFSTLLLLLYTEVSDALVKEQVLRVLLERVIVNRPHPWGLLYTFAQLLRVRSVPLPQAPPEIHAILEHISHLLSDTRPVPAAA